MSEFIISLMAFIFAIALLVTVHEFGHFWVARRLGVKVLRFSFGFGKPLWRFFGKDGVEYVISAFPLGGYVSLLGQGEEQTIPEEQKSLAFNFKPLWARFLIVLAGPLFNFLFAIMAYFMIYMVGISGWVPKIGEVKPLSIAAQAGIVGGEEIIRVDDVPTATWSAVAKQLMNRIGDKEPLHLQTQTPDGIQTHTLNLETWALKGKKPNLLSALGIEPYLPPSEPIIIDLFEEGPGMQAGVLKGDKILAVNGELIQTWQEFTKIVRKNIQKPLKLTLQRGDETPEVTLTPVAKESENGEIVGFAGLITKVGKMPPEFIRYEKLSPYDAFVAALTKTGEYIIISFKIIGKMVTGDIGLQALSGPITIAQGAGQSASIGFQHFFGFLALISISLGVINLLPIPMLDGGHLFYYLIEAITGKPVSIRVQFYGLRIGLLMIILMMTVAFYNDLYRLFSDLRL